MDPTHLQSEELQVELEVREIPVQDPQALPKLIAILKDEEAGFRSIPFKLHSTYGSVPREIDEVREKLKNIDPRAAVRAGDPSLMNYTLSRLIHLRGRVNRLASAAGRDANVEKLSKDVALAIDTCVSSVVNPGSRRQSEGAVGGSSNPQNVQGEALLDLLRGGQVRDSHSSVASAEFVQAQRALSAASLTSQPLRPVQTNFALPHRPDPVRPNTVNGAQPEVASVDLDAEDWARARERVYGGPPVAAPSASGWVMAKWSLRFSGGPRDLPVDEFVFRVETLARLANLSYQALALGLHQILTGNASSWYWVYIRNEPFATWAMVRAALIAAFQSNVSDVAIRRRIMDRLQRPSERFMEFCIAVQELEVRLSVRMSDAELLEILRRNMLPHMQDRLLFVPVDTVLQLQQRVQQIDELMQRQTEVQQVRRSNMNVHEVAALRNDYPSQPFLETFAPYTQPPPPHPAAYQNVQNSATFAPQQSRPPPGTLSITNDMADAIAEHEGYVHALEDRNQYVRCWNCDELGHTHLDCGANRIIYCFGCGTKNVVRPNCPKCSLRPFQGNGRGNVRPQVSQPRGPMDPTFRC